MKVENADVFENIIRNILYLPMNANPGPLCTTSPISTPKLCAMKPSTANTANPQNIAVNTFINETTSVSV